MPEPTCPICGAGITRHGTRGPLPTYCSQRCQGQASYRRTYKPKVKVAVERECAGCGATFETYGWTKFCSKTCSRRATRVKAGRTCSVEGCDRKHVAKGLCGTHYNKANYSSAQRHPMVTVACGHCGAECQKRKDETRFKQHFCSYLCRDIHRGARTVCPLSRRHPVMRILNPPREKRPALPAVERDAECEWCGDPFVTRKAAQRMCSTNCKVKAARVRRRGRQAGSSSHYTWSEVMRVFLANDRRCAYCEHTIEGQPDPDHVVPLSRGGSNSITNILPCCSPCNSDKRDLLLDEWAADRKRRGLPPVTTNWMLMDPRVRHLTCLATAAA